MKPASASSDIDEPAAWPPARPYVPKVESLDEITGWLGTFRERLRIAREHERLQIDAVVKELEEHFQRRRTQLS